MNLSFKVLNMCDTCTHSLCKSHEYQTRCKKYASARFAIELLPMEMLDNKTDAYAAIACNEYDERDDDVPPAFSLEDALGMIKEHCGDEFHCETCRIYHWCQEKDKDPEEWVVFVEKEAP